LQVSSIASRKKHGKAGGKVRKAGRADTAWFSGTAPLPASFMRTLQATYRGKGCFFLDR
jgi:hypothetical protein